MNTFTIVYDGKCSFCQKWVRWVKEHDSNKVFGSVACGTSKQLDLAPEIKEEECLTEVVVKAGSKLYKGGDAIVFILKHIPETKGFGYLLSLPIVSDITRLIYRHVARNRYKLGCESHNCSI